MDPQLKKGLLELLVLGSIKGEPSYGYKMIQNISSVFEISESTLYPILRRLEAQELVKSYVEQHQGRLRKYYQITPKGLTKLTESKNDFEEIKKIYQYILREEKYAKI